MNILRNDMAQTGRIWNFIQEYSLLLVMGAFGALIWANIDMTAITIL